MTKIEILDTMWTYFLVNFTITLFSIAFVLVIIDSNYVKVSEINSSQQICNIEKGIK